jgi:hypothetical protein
MTSVKDQLIREARSLAQGSPTEQKGLVNLIKYVYTSIDEDAVSKCGGDELAALRTRTFWDTYELNSGSNHTNNTLHLARLTSQILMSEAWKGYYNGAGTLCKCSFKEFLKKCGFDHELALISLRKHYPCLLVKFSEALKMTPEERGRLGSEARWHSSADDSYEVDEGQVKVTDKVLRLNRQVEEGNLQAQELLDRIKAKEITKAEAFAILGWEKPENEKKARTLLRKWNSNILDYLDRLEIKADEWLKEAAFKRFEEELYS